MPQSPPQYIHLEDGINHETVSVLICLFQTLPRRAEIHLALTTAGGSVEDGIRLYEHLRTVEERLTTYNPDYVESAGNIPFLAGHTRIAAPRATFFFHELSWWNEDLQDWRPMSESDGQVLRKLQAAKTRFVRTLVERTEIPEAEAHRLLEEECNRDSEWALRQRIIHRIGEFSPPQGVRVRRISGSLGLGGP